VSTNIDPTQTSTKVGSGSGSAPTGKAKGRRPGKEVESGDRGTPFGLLIGMSLLAVLISAPLLWMLSTAFKSRNEMASRDVNIFPTNPTTPTRRRSSAGSSTACSQRPCTPSWSWSSAPSRPTPWPGWTSPAARSSPG
jgi:ABC-type glycerol-3-phosphate transport system permease component